MNVDKIVGDLDMVFTDVNALHKIIINNCNLGAAIWMVDEKVLPILGKIQDIRDEVDLLRKEV